MKDLAKRIKEVSQLRGLFTLKSGLQTTFYFDKYRFESDPKLLYDICLEMMPLIPQDTKVLAGLEMGGIPLAVMLSQLTGIPTAFVRKQRKAYGTCNIIEGADIVPWKTLVVEDVVTSGSAILDAHQEFIEENVVFNQAICVINRSQSGLDNLAEQGIQLSYLFSKEDLEVAL